MDPFSASEWPTKPPSQGESKLKWSAKWLPALLCFYAVFKEIKVAEPYAYKYQTEYLNITAAEMTAEVSLCGLNFVVYSLRGLRKNVKNPKIVVKNRDNIQDKMHVNFRSIPWCLTHIYSR